MRSLTRFTLPAVTAGLILVGAGCSDSDDGRSDREEAFRELIRSEMKADPEMRETCLGLQLFDRDLVKAMFAEGLREGMTDGGGVRGGFRGDGSLDLPRPWRSGHLRELGPG